MTLDEKAETHYPSVSCIGGCRLAVGSILFSRSLLNSRVSSTLNGFNNMSFLPHKTTQAQWEGKRFTSRRPCSLVSERCSGCSARLRAAMLNWRGLDILVGFFLLSGWELKSLSRVCWSDSGALRFTPWALFRKKSACWCCRSGVMPADARFFCSL